MGEEIQGLDPGLLKLGKIQGLDLRLLMTVNTNSGLQKVSRIKLLVDNTYGVKTLSII
jgi:hypothetical protein